LLHDLLRSENDLRQVSRLFVSIIPTSHRFFTFLSLTPGLSPFSWTKITGGFERATDGGRLEQLRRKRT